MKEILNIFKTWFTKSWDKIATLGASAGAGAGVLMFMSEPDQWFYGAMAGLVGRLISYVQIRI